MKKILTIVNDKNFNLYILENVKVSIDEIKDKEAIKRIKVSIDRLAERIPNKPELWESIKGCENLFELKVKPYRLACYLKGSNILILHIWRVQKNMSKLKRADIDKACQIAQEVKDEFERMVGRK